MLEKSFDDAPSTNPCGIMGSLPGSLLGCTYGLLPPMLLSPSLNLTLALPCMK
jgi:hypothetical protein